ncbi:SRPBCC domain-containing protein [Streptomyces sp. NPDC020917]|uniref:SRPBCC domain-containing protein n=1 Tax=Streptomyces sp. NPDC020917 TaxID=3365102 RepID=UPI0037ABB995
MDDRIVQDITINAGLERVWDLVTEPGWWVPTDHEVPVDRTPGHQAVRESAKYGRFPVEVVKLDPRTYAAFRWASQFPGEELAPGRTTLVEFSVEELAEGVRVTVTESGFASLDAPEDVRKQGFSANTEGWQMELGALRTRAEKA